MIFIYALDPKTFNRPIATIITSLENDINDHSVPMEDHTKQWKAVHSGSRMAIHQSQTNHEYFKRKNG